MKRFIGIFVFTVVSSLFTNKNLKANNSSWPPLFLSLKNPNSNDKNADSKKSNNIITGLATYYAQKFEGGLTATGEIFRHSKLTAASNVFALNTWVKVTNILTGKSIIVRINDRMHPSMTKKGRILDLTMTAAKQLHIVNRGVAKVKIETLSDDVAAN
jgi:rare lipoprotein A (peptidoglycan hydrolase)